MVKFKNNPQGTKVLINEYICYKLAEFIGLPVAKSELIYLSRDLIEVEENLKTKEPGIHFGSYYYKDAVDLIGQKVLKNVINIIDIPGIIAFDFWVGNGDRTDNSGNLLAAYIKGQGIKLIMIDHSHCFVDGPNWNCDILNEMHSVEILPFDGKVYREIIKYISGNNPFEHWFHIIENFDDNKIGEIVYNVPIEWGLKEDEKISLVQFLTTRKMDLREALTSQKSKFSKWKDVN